MCLLVLVDKEFSLAVTGRLAPPDAGVALPMSIVRPSSALNLFGEVLEEDRKPLGAF